MYKNSEGQNVDMSKTVKTTEKVSAVLNAPVLKNVSELTAFLGLINYYGRFMENLSSDSAPMYNLLKDDQM